MVLVGPDAAALGEAVSTSADRDGRERLLAVVVGDPDDPAVMLAAQEMAGELWQWAKEKGTAEKGAGEEQAVEGLAGEEQAVEGLAGEDAGGTGVVSGTGVVAGSDP